MRLLHNMHVSYACMCTCVDSYRIEVSAVHGGVHIRCGESADTQCGTCVGRQCHLAGPAAGPGDLPLDHI